MSSAKTTVLRLLDMADVSVNDPRDFDIQVCDERFYKRALSGKDLGFGEAYICRLSQTL